MRRWTSFPYRGCYKFGHDNQEDMKSEHCNAYIMLLPLQHCRKDVTINAAWPWKVGPDIFTRSEVKVHGVTFVQNNTKPFV